MQVSDDMESSSDDDSLESFEDDDGADAELQRIVGRGQGEGRGDVTPKPTNQSSNALVPVEGSFGFLLKKLWQYHNLLNA